MNNIVHQSKTVVKKAVMFIFVFAWSLIGFQQISCAQSLDGQQMTKKKVSKKQQVTDELVQSLNLFYTGIGLAGGGVAVTALGAIQDPVNDLGKIMTYAGLGLSIAGILVIFEGQAHVHNATQIMKLNISGGGVGLSYNF